MKSNSWPNVSLKLKSKNASTIINLCMLFSIILGISDSLFSQEVLLSSIHEAKNDISAREREFIDSNGDASAIIKARIGLKKLNFSTDLGINRIEEREGEVWLWVPPGTSSLSLITEKGDTIITKLPVALHEYSVCVVLFTLKLSPQTEYKDLPVLNIKANPEKTNVFINNIYQGVSPISLSLYPDTFIYRIERKRYNTISGVAIMKHTGLDLKFNLEKSDTTNRYFVTLVTDRIFRYRVNWGFSIGIIGKTGWYFSYSGPLKSYNYDYSLGSVSEDLNFDTYYLSPSEPMSLIIKNSIFSLGITSPLIKSRNVFFTLGISRIRSDCLQYFDMIPYNNERIVSRLLISREDKSFKDAGFDVGLLFRINNNFLISLASSSFFDRKPEYIPNLDIRKYHIEYTTTNFILGIGYNF